MRNRGKTQQFALWDCATKSISLLKSYEKSDSLQSQCQKHGVMKSLRDLKFNELKLDNASTITEGIGIRNIFEFQTLRMTIYYLPKGEVMKLHDHPRMQVVSYVIHGKMQAKIYSLMPDNTYSKETVILEEKSVRFIEGARTTSENLHEFTALQPTFFLDIIFPDYNPTRECSYYEESGQIGDNIELTKVVDHDFEYYKL